MNIRHLCLARGEIRDLSLRQKFPWSRARIVRKWCHGFESNYSRWFQRETSGFLMLASFLESIKYVGHMYPVAFVRIVLGYQSLSTVVGRVNSGYLEHPYISERLNLSMAGESSGLYFEIFKSLIQSQWAIMTYVLIMLEIIIGISYILGFGVRIASLLGMVLSMHIYFFFEFQTSPGQVFLFYIHLLFFMLGAGRCLGLDYYFFKSRRGLLW